jgi:hypothetical protein
MVVGSDSLYRQGYGASVFAHAPIAMVDARRRFPAV